MRIKLNRALKIIIILGVIVVLLVFLNTFKPINGLIRTVFGPPLSLANKIGLNVSNWWQEESIEIDQLKKENQDLKNSIEELSLENVQLKKELESLNELSAQLKFVEDSNLSYVPARVTARPLDQTQNIIFINKGSRHGVQEGQAVIVENGIIIGKVSQASFSTAEVTLLVDQQSRLATEIQNELDTSCLIKGEHGISLLADLIPQTDEIQEGQTIVTSGLEPGIPAGLFVGQVEQIKEGSGELFKQATVKTLVNYSYFDIVTVITGTND